MTVTTRPPAGIDSTELAPVRRALLDLARRDAARTLALADADAAAVLRRADDEVERLRKAARAEAAEDAAQLLAREKARHDREARATELRARGAAYEALVRRTRAAVRALAREPGLRDGLVAQARADLGPYASVHDDEAGVVVELDGRRVVYALDALADEAVARLVSEREAP